MIFHVARAFDVVGLGAAAAELMEDGGERLAHDVGEHVEPPAMGHADDDLADAELAAALDHLLERRHERLAAVQPEALGAGIFHVEKALEGLGLDQLVEDRLLALRGEAHLLVQPLDALLDPAALLGVGDVHVFGADMLAIGPPQNVEDLAERGEFEPERAADEDGAVVIGLGEAVGLGLELGMLAPLGELERIELGDEMAAGAVGADQHARAEGVAGGGHRFLGVDRAHGARGRQGDAGPHSTASRRGRGPRPAPRRVHPRGWRRRTAIRGRPNWGPARSGRKAR